MGGGGEGEELRVYVKAWPAKRTPLGMSAPETLGALAPEHDKRVLSYIIIATTYDMSPYLGRTYGCTCDCMPLELPGNRTHPPSFQADCNAQRKNKALRICSGYFWYYICIRNMET